MVLRRHGQLHCDWIIVETILKPRMLIDTHLSKEVDALELRSNLALLEALVYVQKTEQPLVHKKYEQESEDSDHAICNLLIEVCGMYKCNPSSPPDGILIDLPNVGDWDGSGRRNDRLRLRGLGLILCESTVGGTTVTVNGRSFATAGVSACLRQLNETKPTMRLHMSRQGRVPAELLLLNLIFWAKFTNLQSP
jgi:hypothetical protein